MKIKNYIWDFDGTLFDTYPNMMKAMYKALDDLSVKFDKADLDYFVKEKSMREVAVKYDKPEISDLYHKYETEFQQNPQVYPEIPEILRQTSKKGAKHFILTHRDSAAATFLGNLKDYFTEIISSENDFPRKPNPAAINYLLKKYDLKPSETVMIGDRPLDIQAGENAGVQTILFDEKNYFSNMTNVTKIRKWSDYDFNN